MATTSIHYITNNTISDQSDINQYADILSGVTGAPGITVNSITVNGGPVNFPSLSIATSSLTGAISASGTTTNTITIAGSSTGNPVTVTATGTDPTIGINAITKGANSFTVSRSDGTNTVQIQGSTTGVAPTVAAAGGDANVNLALAGKGTGSVSIGPGGGLTGLTASSVATTAGLNTVETVLKTFPLVAGATLKAGSHIRIVAQGTSTSTGANTTTFNLRAGTAGTTADASVITFVTGAAGTTGTNIVFTFTIDYVVRTLGASGTSIGTAVLLASANTAIGATTQALIQPAASATFATTTATFLTFTHVTAASTTTNTFQNVSIDVLS